LKRIPHIAKAAGLYLASAMVVVLLTCQLSFAQDMPSWWGSNSWFDWSDYRARLELRAFLAKLTSGSISKNNQDISLTGSAYGMTGNPQGFGELVGEIYIDRLGFRLVYGENESKGVGAGSLAFYNTQGNFPINELRLGSLRGGLDLDVIRYPFLRFGFNYDLHFDQIFFYDLTVDTGGVYAPKKYNSVEPQTIGLHGLLIPGRIREMPIIVESRVRFPMPFLNRQGEVKVTDWEISAGLRPSVWETSLYGHTTFAVGLEAGFRSLSIDGELCLQSGGSATSAQSVNVKANWQGPFIQFGVDF
jgi:hypothetical protein